MRFEDLYHCCFNLVKNTNMTVYEDGKEPVKRILEDIYDEIRDREVKWFSVEYDYTVILKLKRGE